jgi:uncharacterized membrane protein
VTGSSDQPRRGRALHPPLTDFPIAAYIFAAAFDVISAIGGPHRNWATQLWHAGTFVLVAGLILCLVTMLTGFFDLVRFPDSRPHVVRTVAAHVATMAGVFMIGSGDIAWRLAEYDSRASTPAGVLALTLVAAAVVCVGAAFGGTLVFRYGVGVTAGVPGAAGTAQAAAPATGLAPARSPAAPGQAAPAGSAPAAPGQAAPAAPGQAAPAAAGRAARHRRRRIR